MHDFSYNYFREIVKEDERYNQLSDEYVDALHTGTWVAVTGIVFDVIKHHASNRRTNHCTDQTDN